MIFGWIYTIETAEEQKKVHCPAALRFNFITNFSSSWILCLFPLYAAGQNSQNAAVYGNFNKVSGEQESNREINKLESLPSSDLLELELVTLSMVAKLGAWSTNNLEGGIILQTKSAIYERIRMQLCNSEK